MKTTVKVLAMLSLAGLLTPAWAGDAEPTPVAFKTHPGPVSNLRNQDSAFSLLIESYRQMQTFMIEGDYDKRLRAASLVKDAKEHDHIAALAAQERDLRLAQLREKLGSFNAAYDTSRHETEKASGVEVPSNVDAKAAGDQLRKFVPFTPGTLGPGEDQPSHLLPAGAQMIYSQRR